MLALVSGCHLGLFATSIRADATGGGQQCDFPIRGAEQARRGGRCSSKHSVKLTWPCVCYTLVQCPIALDMFDTEYRRTIWALTASIKHVLDTRQRMDVVGGFQQRNRGAKQKLRPGKLRPKVLGTRPSQRSREALRLAYNFYKIRLVISFWCLASIHNLERASMGG